ncbi:unnamed protein product, partial [Discosporangium mesarthrocarpum]
AAEARQSISVPSSSLLFRASCVCVAFRCFVCRPDSSDSPVICCPLFWGHMANVLPQAKEKQRCTNIDVHVHAPGLCSRGLRSQIDEPCCHSSRSILGLG